MKRLLALLALVAAVLVVVWIRTFDCAGALWPCPPLIVYLA